MVGLPWSIWSASGHDSQQQPEEDIRQPSLHHYAKPGSVPPSARVEHTLKAAERPRLRPWHMWKYGVVAISKATEMTGAVLSHSIWGPKRPTWGLEMTIITSFMRGAGRHSALVDIATIRMIMSIVGLIPLPSDALVTPVTFRVRRRKLRGFLADLDAAEDGKRELSGEWVVGRRTWHRLQSEWKQTQQRRSSSSAQPPERKTERVVLYIHGGAYYLSSAAGQRLITIPLSKYTDARVFALDYRLAPETRFPGPLHDAVSAYLRLVEELHIPSENIIVAGDSAGGGLTLALLMYLRDNAYPLPSAALLMSPWVDLTMSCESWDLNEPYDVVPIPIATNHMHPIALYLGDQVDQYLTHPYASPLFGDFTGLPPLLIQAGDAEVLRDEIALLAHKATLAGVEVRHELYEDAVHIFQTYPFLDSAQRAFMSMREFVRTNLPPQRLHAQAKEGLGREIHTARAHVVRGDGEASEIAKEDLEDEERSSSEEETVNRRDGYFTSWGPSRFSMVSPPTSDDEDDRVEDVSSAVEPSQTPMLRRISSVASVILPEHRTPLTRHSSHHRRRSNSQTQMPAVTPSAPAPSPSIRRRSITSHPDITKLVENWTQQGPANETLVYKHPSPSLRTP